MNELTPEQLELFDKLTSLQQRVCLGVLVGLPQIAAYRMGGGTAKTDTAQSTSASEIMRNHDVKAFTDSVMQSRAAAAVVDRNEVLEKLTTIIREKPGDEITKVAADKAAMEAIRQIRSMEGWDAAQRVDVQGKVDVSLDPELLARKLVFMLDNGKAPIDILPESAGLLQLNQGDIGDTQL